MRVGITGNSGFVGGHLRAYLPEVEKIQIVDFEKSFFDSHECMDKFVSSCDAIIHLAEVIKHPSEMEMREINIGLAKSIMDACSRTNSSPHIIYASSIHENNSQHTASFKKEIRLIFRKWAEEKKIRFNALVLPNLFGPFGRPFHNSVVSTFCYQVVNGEQPKILQDREVPLVYIDEIAKKIYEVLTNESGTELILFEITNQQLVSEILKKLFSFHESYFSNGILPDVEDAFTLQLFNTYRSYISDDKRLVFLNGKEDPRGCLVEIIKSHGASHIFYSTTEPGVTRGNHYHRRKVERFCVVSGEAEIAMRRVGSDEVVRYKVSGAKPSFIDIPVLWTHNITNLGSEPLLTLFWASEIFDEKDPDTYFQQV